MKDVAGCDKPRGAAKQALIRGFPNGATQPVEDRLLREQSQLRELKHLST